MPELSVDLNVVIAPILIAASILSAAWLLLRVRRGMDRSQANAHGATRPAGRAEDNAAGPETGDSHATVRWLVRLGVVVSAVVLTALVVGDPLLVINAVALAMVAIAFVLILVLVPRGL